MMINDLPMGLELGSSTPRSLVSSQNITILYDFGMVKMGPLLKKNTFAAQRFPSICHSKHKVCAAKALACLALGPCGAAGVAEGGADVEI